VKIITSLVTAVLLLGCDTRVYVEEDMRADYTKLYNEIKQLHQTVEELREEMHKAAGSLSADAKLAANMKLIEIECPKFLERNYNIKDAKLYRDFRPGTIKIADFHSAGCRVFIPHLIAKGELFKFIDVDELIEHYRKEGNECSQEKQK
jgi:outer membrane murein-binding lipoprotein Lpp